MQVVLVNPQIPQNTGSIARTCAALNIELILIEPLGFQISDKHLKRAGLDYWQWIKIKTYPSWQDYINNNQAVKKWYFTTKAKTPFWEAKIGIEDALVFGSETKGLGEKFLNQCCNSSKLTLPMLNKNIRSLNLSNTVTTAVYRALEHNWSKIKT